MCLRKTFFIVLLHWVYSTTYVLRENPYSYVIFIIADLFTDTHGGIPILSHENKNALNPFYHKNIFERKLM